LLLVFFIYGRWLISTTALQSLRLSSYVSIPYCSMFRSRYGWVSINRAYRRYYDNATQTEYALLWVSSE